MTLFRISALTLCRMTIFSITPLFKVGVGIERNIHGGARVNSERQCCNSSKQNTFMSKVCNPLVQ